MEGIPLPSGPKNTIEVNPWTTGQKYPVIQARCGDAVVFTWTPSEARGVFRPVKPPTADKDGAWACACPKGSVVNGTAPEGLMLAPVTRGGSYRYIVINETEPFCVTSQAQGDCAKGVAQIIRPSCPPAPPSASSAARAAAAGLALAASALVAMGVVVA
jgi:hypothetical protein